MRVSQKTETIIREEGFTLLEVIIAISILTVGLLAVASMQIMAISGNSTAYRLTEATNRTQVKLEQLLGLPYNAPDLSEGEHRESAYVTWHVEDINSVNNAKLITVEISWQDRGVEKTTRLICIRPKL